MRTQQKVSIMTGWSIWSNAFSASIERILRFSSFVSLTWRGKERQNWRDGQTQGGGHRQGGRDRDGEGETARW